MGTASSVQPKQGVHANPRVLYADQLSKKSKKKDKDYIIDTPVLIDLKHGSIRYRYVEEEKEHKDKFKKVEVPFEGEETGTARKGHYFYHPRLNDFSEKASVEKEDAHKFMYVMKGPASSQQKKVFYVYGKGWGAKDGMVVKPTATKEMGQDPTWPLRQHPNDVYYNITFLDHAVTEDPIPGIPNRYKIQYSLSATETVNDLRGRIAKTVLKSASYIHICYQKKELQLFDVISNLLRSGTEDIPPSQFGIEVTFMDH